MSDGPVPAGADDLDCGPDFVLDTGADANGDATPAEGEGDDTPTAGDDDTDLWTETEGGRLDW